MRRLPWALFLLASCSGPDADTHSKDPYERYLGLKEIAENQDLASEPEIIRLLDDPHYLVVTGALEVLAVFRRKEYLAYALPRLQAPHPMVRAQACETVAAVGGAEGMQPVLAVLRGDADPVVRRAAVKVAASHYGGVLEVRRLLVETLGDRDPALSYMAYEKLRELTGRRDLPRTREAWSAIVPP